MSVISNRIKVFFTVVICIVFAVILFVYWTRNSGTGSINDIENDIEHFIQICTKENRYNVNLERITKTQYHIKNSHYASPSLKSDFDLFKQAWENNGELSPKDSSTWRNNLTVDIVQIKTANYNLATNQAISLVIILIIFVLFFSLARHTDFLRDLVGNWDNINRENIFLAFQNADGEAKPPYSLARTQLAVWTFIIGSIYIYAILWDRRNFNALNQTALILMGISAATFITGAIFDLTEINQNKPRVQDEPSEGFFKDLLSDKKEISIHRFQNVVWTIIAIIIYIYKYNNPGDKLNELPELDATILTLSGISNATYLAFKARENTFPITLITSIQIKLQFDTTVPNSIVQNILNSSQGLRTAVVEVKSTSTGDLVHAVPLSANSKTDFVVNVLEANKYNKVSVTWKGKPNPSDTVDTTLVGESNEVIDKSGQIITIQLKVQ
ncbi:hypothetical protein HRH25_21760 [Flavisolibacter sp. BT320]|nr:hypothetical protein [Flavisolibacter longurius]